MARRERKKETVIREVVDVLERKILDMDIGERASINPMVYYHYSQLGYERKHLGFSIGYALTRDEGKTYLLSDMDLMVVLEQLEKKLHGERRLDFSAYDNLEVGLPYNLTFVIRKDSSGQKK